MGTSQFFNVEAAPAEGVLKKGWMECADTISNQLWYWHEASDAAQLEKPELVAEVSFAFAPSIRLAYVCFITVVVFLFVSFVRSADLLVLVAVLELYHTLLPMFLGVLA